MQISATKRDEVVNIWYHIYKQYINYSNMKKKDLYYAWKVLLYDNITNLHFVGSLYFVVSQQVQQQFEQRLFLPFDTAQTLKER